MIKEYHREIIGNVTVVFYDQELPLEITLLPHCVARVKMLDLVNRFLILNMMDKKDMIDLLRYMAKASFETGVVCFRDMALVAYIKTVHPELFEKAMKDRRLGSKNADRIWMLSSAMTSGE